MEMVLARRRSGRFHRSGRRHSAGFNLIEVLIASVLFLVVALGVLPLFQRAIRTNTAGQSSTDVANLARSQVERYMQIEYNSPLLTVPAGQTELVLDDYFDRATEQWIVGAPPQPTDADWLRTTTVRYYNVAAVRESSGEGLTADDDDDLETGIICADTVAPECDTAEPLDGGTAPIDVHFKEIEVQVVGTLAGGGILGPSKRIVARALRSQ